MEALVRAETLAVSMPLLVVTILQLPLPEEGMRGLLDLEEPQVTGVPHLQRRPLGGEAKTAGKCCLVIHPWADGTLPELS